MKNESKIHTHVSIIGDLSIKFEGEQFSGLPILDTKVLINDETICWITWENKEKFLNELNEVINKYQI